ncbi:hypothetical protein BC332_01418 [Capsicum chinense]|nr:hypothetical protein BC332_01418 [Capsicum chinense]
MNVKVLSKECIKPSVPTPQHLRSYKLSFLDQFTLCSYIPIILFYNGNHDHDDIQKKSPSETRSYCHPLAGRFKDNVHSIECNDEGILYVEAQANFDLSTFLENPDIPFLNKFLPCKGNCLEPNYNQPLLAIQTTTFLCGGIAIGLCMLHKVRMFNQGFHEVIKHIPWTYMFYNLHIRRMDARKSASILVMPIRGRLMVILGLENRELSLNFQGRLEDAIDGVMEGYFRSYVPIQLNFESHYVKSHLFSSMVKLQYQLLKLIIVYHDTFVSLPQVVQLGKKLTFVALG